MEFGDYLPYGVAALAVAQAVVEFRSAKGHERSTAKLVIAFLTLACTASIISRDAKDEEDQRLAADALADLTIAHTKALDASRAETAKAREDVAAARAETEKTTVNCYLSRLGNEATTKWIDGLKAWQVAALKAAGCGPPPPWAQGSGQIRIVTGRSADEARQRRTELMILLNSFKDQNWTANLTGVVETVSLDRQKRDHTLYVVALNRIEATMSDAVCSWLACKGVEPGAERCGLRDTQSALGQLGNWPTERDPAPR